MPDLYARPDDTAARLRRPAIRELADDPIPDRFERRVRFAIAIVLALYALYEVAVHILWPAVRSWVLVLQG